MKDEFLKAEDFNVIIVGWGNGAKFPDYPQAVSNTRLVATQTNRLILELVKLGGRMDQIHLIGHSLGAHTCGLCGYLLKGKLKRITGLDPAGPDFIMSPPIVVLDKGDALFVDIIHSNAKSLAEGGAGMFNSSGHVDFYLNGGKTQPGCHDGLSAILNGGDLKAAVSCSHGRSHNVFIESINSQCPFTSYPCDTYANFQSGRCLSCGRTGCSVLGYYSDQYHARGKMYLNTGSKLPFCGYHYGVTIVGAKTPETKGLISLRLKGKWGDSGFVPVTKKDETLKGQAIFSHVVVSPAEVGDVEEVTIKYNKLSGFWFSKGEESYAVEKVDVVSGENGSQYTFCLQDKELKHGTEVKTVKSSAKYRC
ncbi:hypothetical protein LOTGIDRAFT_233162 [Lottia gigantea]|uniref:Lipase domain-containing protein n=1 Tax=Lottia gigantea TaxID=225164 RepID=V4A6S1_LOTGI|nr:hypothetical protein LOTGIDRAFT_233162 [Lottia gigantea]ESO92402.1 hypothetical protein LOTGIDRAFT_233162 [Lottia gigantea]